MTQSQIQRKKQMKQTKLNNNNQLRFTEEPLGNQTKMAKYLHMLKVGPDPQPKQPPFTIKVKIHDLLL